MREQLAGINGTKGVFYGTFCRYGWRKFRGQYVGKTVLLVDIRDSTGNLLCDHLWFRANAFEKMVLKPGQVIRFEGKVKPYSKYRGEEFDYKLAWIKNLRLVENDTLRETGQQTLLGVFEIQGGESC